MLNFAPNSMQHVSIAKPVSMYFFTLWVWALHSHCPACQLSASYFTHKAFQKGMHSGFQTLFFIEGLNGGLSWLFVYILNGCIWAYTISLWFALHISSSRTRSNKRRQSQHIQSISIFWYGLFRLMWMAACAPSPAWMWNTWAPTTQEPMQKLDFTFSPFLFLLLPLPPLPPASAVQIQVIEDDRVKTTEPFTTGVRGQAPPLVTSNFHVKDQGEGVRCSN